MQEAQLRLLVYAPISSMRLLTRVYSISPIQISLILPA